METSYAKCPNCDKSLKGIFGSEILPQAKTDFINKQLDQNREAYCKSCSPALLNQISEGYQKQKDEIEIQLKQILHYIPLITCPAPAKWEYEVIGMVTAQTTSGEGFSTELSQSFNEFFGTSSKATNRKILAAINTCKANLRVQCATWGGNAIISTDIDFNEIGGAGKMLMVCMAGTAIKVTDMSCFNARSRDTLTEISELTEKLQVIEDVTR